MWKDEMNMCSFVSVTTGSGIKHEQLCGYLKVNLPRPADALSPFCRGRRKEVSVLPGACKAVVHWFPPWYDCMG